MALAEARADAETAVLAHRKTEIGQVTTLVRAAADAEHRELHELVVLGKLLDRCLAKDFAALESLMPLLQAVYRRGEVRGRAPLLSAAALSV